MKTSPFPLYYTTLFILLTACSGPSGADNMLSNITARDLELQHLREVYAPMNELKEKASELSILLQEFVDTYPDHSFAPEALMLHAMLLAELLDEFEKAARQFYLLHSKYPGNPLSEQALFLAGYTMAEMVGDADRAGGYYREFMDCYPDSELAGSVAFELQNLGRSPEDILTPDLLNQAE